MPRLQEVIYQFEEGIGRPWLRAITASVALLFTLVCYNWFCFQNMGTQEAMDCAQVARNIAEGKGFTTLFVRPFSIRLLTDKADNNRSLRGPWEVSDPAQLNPAHPDLANAPLYPLILAGLMKVLPFDYQVDLTHRFWSGTSRQSVEDSTETRGFERFRRYQPDFLISAFNQVMLLAVATFSFLLARRLFDLATAVFSTVLLLGTDLLWRFAISGLPTVFLMLVFLGLIWCVVRLEHELASNQGVAKTPNAPSRAPGAGEMTPHQVGTVGEKPNSAALLWAGVAGAVVGLGALTRYPFAWMILPLLLFILSIGSRHRLVLAGVSFLGFVFVLSPWILRNYRISGLPFGVATYAMLEGASFLPGHSFQRSLDVGLGFPGLILAKLAWHKLLTNSNQLVQNDLPRIGATWVSGFFMVGLFVPLPDRHSRRLAIFLVCSLCTLAIVQGLARTEISTDSPEINSENFLVLLVPAVWIYGASLFYRLLGQLGGSPGEALRPFIVCGFWVVTCLPMILSLLVANRAPVVFPPYYPPSIQAAAGYLKPGELMMSDIPWAVAWYGRAQCVWLTQTKRDFFAINDEIKPIQALYLTHAGGGNQFQSFDQWVRAGQENWGDFIMSCLFQKQQGKPGPPPDFPLEYWQKGWPQSFLLTRHEEPAAKLDAPAKALK